MLETSSLMLTPSSHGTLGAAASSESFAFSAFSAITSTEKIFWPSRILTALPIGLPKAWLIPFWIRSACAPCACLFSLRIWCGKTLTLRKNSSLPILLMSALLMDILALSRALSLTCTPRGLHLTLRSRILLNSMRPLPMLNCLVLIPGTAPM